MIIIILTLLLILIPFNKVILVVTKLWFSITTITILMLE